MNRKRQVVFSSVLGVFYIGLILGGFGLHFWTVKMIYHLQGRGLAIVAFMFPVGAEVFWALREWRLLGFVNLKGKFLDLLLRLAGDSWAYLTPSLQRKIP